MKLRMSSLLRFQKRAAEAEPPEVRPLLRKRWFLLLLVLALFLPFAVQEPHSHDGFTPGHAAEALFSGRSAIVAAHLAMLPFLLLLFPALRWLGPMGPDWRGLALLLTSPLVVVLAHSLSAQIPALSCHLLALGLLVEGERRRSAAFGLLSAVPAAAAMLLDGSASRILIPIGVLAWLLGVGWRRILLIAALSALPVALLQLLTELAQGDTQFYLAMSSPRPRSLDAIPPQRSWTQGRLAVLAALGCLPMAAALVVLGLRMRGRAGAALLFGITLGLICPLPRLGLRLQLALWSAAGCFALLLVAGETLRIWWDAPRRGAHGAASAALWTSWFWLEALFAVAGSIDAASDTLPMVPPLAFLAAAAWQRLALGSRLFGLAVAANVVFAFALSAADFEETEVHARALGLLDELPAAGGRTFVMGQWSVQALRQAGLRHLDQDQWLRPGDRILRSSRIPTEPWQLNPRVFEGIELERTRHFPIAARWPLRLNDPTRQAGFWGSGAGPLPIALSRGPVEEFEIYEVRPLPPFLRATAEVAARLETRVGPAPPGGAMPRLGLVRLADGVPRAVVGLHPPAVLSFDLGPGSGLLYLGLALHPEASSGDGAYVKAYVESADGATRTLLLEGKATDSRWTILQEGLAIPPEGARLLLAAETGPAGDPAADWLCVRLEWIGEKAPEVRRARVSFEEVRPILAAPSAVVLLTVDTLRADAVSFAGSTVPATPFLDRLTRRSAVFGSAYAASSWTPPSMASLFTSLYLSSHGIVMGALAGIEQVQGIVLPESFLTLAEALNQAGYTTIGVSANRHLSPILGYAQGFDLFEVAPFVDAEQVNIRVRSQLQKRFGPNWRQSWKQGKTFLWIHYFDPHAPYIAREPWIDLYAPGWRNEPAAATTGLMIPELDKLFQASPDRQRFARTLRGLYDSEVSYLDRQLADLWDDLGLDDENVLLVFTADHGEEFAEHGGLGHGFRLYEELIHVPFFVHWPKALPSGRCVDAPASLVDVFPTLVELLGLEPQPGLQGQSLASLLRGYPAIGRRPVLAEIRPPAPWLHAYREGPWKLIQNQMPPYGVHLFDLSRDPGEITSLAAQYPGEVHRLAAAMNAWRSTMPPPPEIETVGIEDEQLREQLEGLGYVGP
jgi:arylsulfatase A-like enzyme